MYVAAVAQQRTTIPSNIKDPGRKAVDTGRLTDTSRVQSKDSASKIEAVTRLKPRLLGSGLVELCVESEIADHWVLVLIGI